VARDDLAHHRQADAGAFEFAHAVQPLERPKKLVRIVGIEARTVVAHEECIRAVREHFVAELDAGIGRLRRELPRVSEQVLQDVRQQAHVPAHRVRFVHRDSHGARGLGFVQALQHRARDRGNVHRLVQELGVRDVGERQQSVREVGHQLYSGANAVQVVAAFLIEVLRQPQLELRAESVDGRQRRTQVVRERVRELAQVVVAFLQLRRAMSDALFHHVRQQHDFFFGAALLGHVDIRRHDRMRRTCLIAQQRAVTLDGHRLAGRWVALQLTRPLAVGQQCAQVVLRQRCGVAEQLRECAADRLLARDAEQAFGAPVPEQDSLVEVVQCDRLARVLDDLRRVVVRVAPFHVANCAH
jgi:hypothetical protein